MISKKYILFILSLFCTQQIHPHDSFDSFGRGALATIIVLPICFAASFAIKHCILPSILLSLKNPYVIDRIVWVLAKTRLLSQWFIDENNLYFDAVGFHRNTKKNIELALAIVWHYDKLIGHRSLDLEDTHPLLLAASNNKPEIIERFALELESDNKEFVLYGCLREATYNKNEEMIKLVCNRIEEFDCGYRFLSLSQDKPLLFDIAARADNLPAFKFFLNKSKQQNLQSITFDEHSTREISALLNKDKELCQSFFEQLSKEQRLDFHVNTIESERYHNEKKKEEVFIKNFSVVKESLESLRIKYTSPTPQITG